MRALAYLVLSHYDEGDTLLQQVMYRLSERGLYEYEEIWFEEIWI